MITVSPPGDRLQTARRVYCSIIFISPTTYKLEATAGTDMKHGEHLLTTSFPVLPPNLL